MPKEPPRAPTGGPDAVELILEDHAFVDALFEEFLALEAGNDERKSEIAEELITELSIHAAVEEQVLYPSVREALTEGDAVVEGSLDDHQEVKEILNRLDGMEPADQDFEELMAELIDEVRTHVAEEEGVILPAVSGALSAEQLAEMGTAIERAKKLAPTRPHPHAPSTPPSNVVAGAAVGAVDRAHAASRSREKD